MGENHAQNQVWIRDEHHAWVAATLFEKKAADENNPDGKTTFFFRREEDGETVEILSETGAIAEHNDVKLRNIQDNVPTDLSKVKDLTKLIHLHEPAILEALCKRFLVDQIYTYTGPILLAVNPFKQLQLYTPQILENYYTTGLLKSQNLETPELDPHVYAIGDNAYRSLVDSGDAVSGQNKKNQSILVSGESGAGKTESTKFIMRYLATVAGSKDTSSKTAEGAHAIADMVLQSNPILEAFGNARTIRNDNSSRFGKFIEMQFDAAGKLVGARIVTYLLEKVRLAHQGENERNFHVFYQIYGADQADLERWKIPDKEECPYINQSGCYERKDGVDDVDMHKRMLHAMDVMGFSDEEREQIFGLVGSVMNLAGLEFIDTHESGKEGCVISTDGLSGTSYENLAELLQVDKENLLTGLSTRKIKVGLEDFTKGLTAKQATSARDALSKDIYSRMFNWLVQRVNHSIEHKTKIRSFIGVLDIFGFEVFERNSFEQLCINYANETLQQQFNEFVFKLEQKEYEKEGIKWSFIDFPDNQACLDLIEGKLGVIALLDEQCLFPKGNDESLASKFYSELGNNAQFDASRKHKVNFEFVIQHYAGSVCYNTEGFCNKNKDQLHQELHELLYTSKNGLVQTLYPKPKDSGTGTGPSKRSSIRLVTVGTQFKNQLSKLLTTIRETSPHYIRCLKPNDSNVPAELVRPRLVDQLRYGGVLEAVKVARAGYPTRLTLGKFAQRYFMLAKDMQVSNIKSNERAACDKVLAALDLIPEEEYQIGRTKVFLRKNAYEKIESKRSQSMKIAAFKIQAIMKGAKHRKYYLQLKRSTLTVQTLWRGISAKREAQFRRETNSAIVLQRIGRGFVAKSNYQKTQKNIILLQNWRRSIVAHRAALELRAGRSGLILQSWVRMILARKQLLSVKQAVTQIQCAHRCAFAKRELKRLRVEAKQVGNLQGKVEDLQQRLQNMEVKLAKELDRRRLAESAVEESEQRANDATARVTELTQQLDELKLEMSNRGSIKQPSSFGQDDAMAPVPSEMEKPVPNFDDNTSADELRKALQSAHEKLAENDVQFAALRAQLIQAHEESQAKGEIIVSSKEHNAALEKTANLEAQVESLKNDLQAATNQLDIQETAKRRASSAMEQVHLDELDKDDLLKQANSANLEASTLKEENELLKKQLDEQRKTMETEKLDSTKAVKQELEKVSLELASSQKLIAKLSAGEKVDVVSNTEEMVKLQQQLNDAHEGMIEIQQSKNELQETVEVLQESLERISFQMCDSENRANDLHDECAKLKKQNGELNTKVGEMETLTKQASGVKIILGRRLESLILENRVLRQNKMDLEEKLDYYTETNKLLTNEVKDTRKKLHDTSLQNKNTNIM